MSRALRYAILALLAQACSLGSASGSDPLAASAKADDSQAVLRCRIVSRAARTWVGFDEGLSIKDVEMLARASSVIIKTLDLQVCALRSGTADNAALRGERTPLLKVMRSKGSFEVTSIEMHKRGTLGAKVLVRAVDRYAKTAVPPPMAAASKAGGKPVALAWQAIMTADKGGWKLLELARAAVRDVDRR